MAKSYTHPEVRNVNGKDFGLAVLARVSGLSLAEARPIEWHRHDETVSNSPCPLKRCRLVISCQNFAKSGSSMLRFAVRKLTPTSVTGRLSPLYAAA